MHNNQGGEEKTLAQEKDSSNSSTSTTQNYSRTTALVRGRLSVEVALHGQAGCVGAGSHKNDGSPRLTAECCR